MTNDEVEVGSMTLGSLSTKRNTDPDSDREK